MPRIEIERIDQAEETADDGASEDFDRLAFAERAVALVRPPRTKVAICEGSRRVQVSAGRDWGNGPEGRWALLQVPKNASRRAIASAVLGLHDGAARAWTLDVLLSGAIYR